jgi:hypothetical protein
VGVEHLVEQVIVATKRGDWDDVLHSGARLYRAARASGDHRLAEATSDAMSAALLLLEHPVFEAVSASLSRVALRQLLDAWDDPV